MQETRPSEESRSLTPEQRRNSKRLRVLKSAKIVLDDWRAIDCQLRDMSSTGARIRVGSTRDLPDTFRLYVTADNSIRDVALAWKHHDEVGVKFTSAAKACALRKF